MASNNFTSRLMKLKLGRQLKHSRGSVTAANGSIALESLFQRPDPAAANTHHQPRPYSEVPGPKAYPVIGGILNYLPGGKIQRPYFTNINFTKT